MGIKNFRPFEKKTGINWARVCLVVPRRMSMNPAELNTEISMGILCSRTFYEKLCSFLVRPIFTTRHRAEYSKKSCPGRTREYYDISFAAHDRTKRFLRAEVFI